ncbi:Pyridoxal kinase [Carabus blaptoides fortunei]
MAESPRVLSIQSHVVSGYVGNKSATFPLQLLGFEVDAINSVQFSNHTGYKAIKGQVLKDQDLADLIEGLKLNNIDHYSHLLTGYVGSPSFLNQIAEVIRHVKTINPNIIYVCDPVMGDNGHMYVPEELLPIYKDIIVPLADVITPNQYEVELLTGIKVANVNDAWKAIDNFHEKGCKTVVLSSTELGDDKNLLAIASSIVGDTKTAVTIDIPKLPAQFTGTGDLFAALLMAWMHKTNNQIKIAIERTIATMQAVLNNTIKECEGKNKTPANIELKLIQSKRDIENPNVTIYAKTI